MASDFPHVEAAEAYVDAVLTGTIPACRWVRLACERHRADMARAETDPTYPFEFDAAKADRVCRFIVVPLHSKGHWAARREPFELQGWQAFLTCVLFGWVRRPTRLRRFRRAYIKVCRKNGKSEWAARIGLYMLVADGEHGAEVYSGATSEHQAWEVFRPALTMVRNTPALQSRFGVVPYKSSIAVPLTASRFEPLIGNPGDGASPSCALVDEYHEHQTDDLSQTMLTGMGARLQPLLVWITTAGSDTSGPCYQQEKEAERMLSGLVADDELFAVMWGLDDEDDWMDPAMLEKANPNYGVSVSADFLLARHKDAMESTRQQGAYQTKHLNRWVGARTAYFDLPRWMACRRPIELSGFHGRRVRLGLDLASTVDIAALALLFHDPDRDVFSLFAKFYLPEATVELESNKHYQAWAREGRIVVTDGDITDYRRIRDDIEDLARILQVEDIGYDPFQATYLVNELTGLGLPCVEVRSTVQNFSQPMKELDGLIRAGRIEHDGCPVLTWMIGNVTAKEDRKENVYPNKDRRENKIDGVVALLAAMARHMTAPKPKVSIYESRGLLLLDDRGGNSWQSAGF